MKLLSLILTFCLTTNVFASTTNARALEAMIDDYQYFATVDWDQKDKSVMDQKTEAFRQDLASLVSSKGINKTEFISVLSKKMPANSDKIKARLSVLPDTLSFEALMQEVQLMQNDLYQKGASWNGEIDWSAVGVIAALVLVVGLAAWYGQSQKLTEKDIWGEKGKPKSYVCTGWGDKWECTYTDSTYGSTTTSTSSCGWVYQCTSGYFEY